MCINYALGLGLSPTRWAKRISYTSASRLDRSMRFEPMGSYPGRVKQMILKFMLTSKFPSWYHLRRCQDVELQQPTKLSPNARSHCIVTPLRAPFADGGKRASANHELAPSEPPIINTLSPSSVNDRHYPGTPNISVREHAHNALEHSPDVWCRQCSCAVHLAATSEESGLIADCLSCLTTNPLQPCVLLLDKYIRVTIRTYNSLLWCNF